MENYSKKRVTLVGYLVGLSESDMAEMEVDKEYLAKIKEDEELEIIRSLSILRTDFMFSYEKIYKEKSNKGCFAQFQSMHDLIDVKALGYLEGKQIYPLDPGVNNKNFTKHIANINQLIAERIDSVSKHIPDWIDWELIKNMFIMPDAASGINGNHYKKDKKATQINNTIHQIRKRYCADIAFYPCSKYINWNVQKSSASPGNILEDDYKFLKSLYKSHGKFFGGERYVIEVDDETKNNIYHFVEKAEKVRVFVDCENVNPYNFVAALISLDKTKLSKIQNINLVKDDNVTNAWTLIEETLNLPVIVIHADRIKSDKSLVDHMLSLAVSKGVYKEKVDSIVVASSDSDFWSLVMSLEDVNFFWMLENDKTSDVLVQRLCEYNISHFFINKFGQDKVQFFKDQVLLMNLQILLDDFNETGIWQYQKVDTMLDKIFQMSGVVESHTQKEKEKLDFFKQHIKKLKIVFEGGDLDSVLKIVYE